MFGKKSRDEAQTVIPFAEGTQEHFEAFADDVCALVDGALVSFQDQPVLGVPYAIVWIPDEGSHYTLIVDAGQAFCKRGKELWVSD